ncbi:MAG: hypothetical protein ACPGVG_14795, partial [Mycobacterium sp.]
MADIDDSDNGVDGPGAVTLGDDPALDTLEPTASVADASISEDANSDDEVVVDAATAVKGADQGTNRGSDSDPGRSNHTAGAPRDT